MIFFFNYFPFCYCFFCYIVLSESLNTQEYWGTWQQMLCGKVIADWLDPDYVPLDPIFGILLNPTGGITFYEKFTNLMHFFEYVLQIKSTNIS